MKNFKVVLTLLVVIMCMTACGGSESEESKAEGAKAGVSFETESEESKADFPFKISTYDSYRNDVTGNWRRAAYAGSEIMQDYALDYYKTFFQSDDEIHFVWNATLKTVTKIMVVGTDLDVCTYEYVNGEEHDAKLAVSGMLLKEVFVNIENGEVEEIQ